MGEGNNQRCYVGMLILAFLLAFTSVEDAWASAGDDKGMGILVVSSYSPVRERGNRLIEAFTEEIRSHSQEHVYAEYMNCEDSFRFDGWVKWFRRMISVYSVKPRIIVLLGNESWSAYREVCPESWHDIPVVLGGVKRTFIDYKHLYDGGYTHISQLKCMEESFGSFPVTGYYIKDYPRENIQLIKRLQPNIKHITFCYDNRYSAPYIDNYLEIVTQEAAPMKVFSLLGNRMTTAQMVDSLVSLGSDDALLSAGWYSDSEHDPHAYPRYHNELSRLKKIGIYQMIDEGWSNMHYLGGYYVLGREIGTDVARLTLQVMNKGIVGAESFRQMPSPPRYYINYPALQTLGISEKRLPDHDVVLYNKKLSFFESYPYTICGSLFFFLCVVLLLLRENKRNLRLLKNRQVLDFTLHSSWISPWEYDCKKKTFTITWSPADRKHTTEKGWTFARLEEVIHPDDLSVVPELIDSLVSGTCRQGYVQLRTKNPGEEEFHWFEMHARVSHFDRSGRPEQIIGLRHDISELKRTEELVMMRNKAEEANRLKSAFLANMSHEIRTPLNAIVGFSNLMTDSDEPEEKQEFCRIINDNNDLLLRLIDDILDMSKIEAGYLDFVYSDVDLTLLMRDMEHVHRLRFGESVAFSCQVPDHPVVINSDSKRLMQVLSNFLSNARKYTAEGSVTMGYRPDTDATGKPVVYFYVTDTGKGIAEENLPHVFERFTKFDAFVQGTGLGLSICELIIRKMEGEIGVESKLGVGSTFWFTLPLGLPKEQSVH